MYTMMVYTSRPFPSTVVYLSRLPSATVVERRVESVRTVPDAPVAVEAADVNQLPPRVEAREESADDDEDEEDREDDAEEPVDAE